MRKKIKIALYDSDGYMVSLVNYLCRKKQEIVETRLFTNRSMLKDYVMEGQVDVLLAQEEEEDWVMGLGSFVPKIILLIEGSMLREHTDYIPVFRYQSAEEVVREVMEAVAEDDRIIYNSAFTVHRQGEVICGFSPFGGAGLSTFLTGMARESAGSCQTLYVSLEQFCGIKNAFSDKRGQAREQLRGMSEVIYYLQQRKEKLAIKLESIICEWEQLHCILAVENYHDLQQMTRADMERLLQILFDELYYEKVIFDIGYLGEATEYLLEQCERIYMPVPRTPVQEMKQQACEQTWGKQGDIEILEKICQVTMGWEEEVKSDR